MDSPVLAANPSETTSSFMDDPFNIFHNAINNVTSLTSPRDTYFAKLPAG